MVKIKQKFWALMTCHSDDPRGFLWWCIWNECFFWWCGRKAGNSELTDLWDCNWGVKSGLVVMQISTPTQDIHLFLPLVFAIVASSHNLHYLIIAAKCFRLWNNYMGLMDKVVTQAYTEIKTSQSMVAGWL